MKNRTVSTSFYNSDRILSISSDARWLFMYFITCQHIGLTGAFKLSRTKILFETGLTPKELESSCMELEEKKLAFLRDGWIVIPDTQEKTNYNKSPITQKAYEKELSSLPEEIKKLLAGIDTRSSEYAAGMPRLEIINRNKKKEGGVGETIFPNPKSVTDEVCESVALEKNIPLPYVKNKRDQMVLWAEEGGHKKKNWKMTLLNWISRDEGEGKVPSGGYKKVSLVSEDILRDEVEIPPVMDSGRLNSLMGEMKRVGSI